MPRDDLHKPNPVVLYILNVVLTILGWVYFRLSCTKDRAMIAELKTQTRPIIIVFNHTSHLDVPAVGICLGVGLMRRVIMPGKKELFGSPVLAWLLPRLGVIPLDRDINDMHVVRTLLQALQQGRMMIIAPEGTRSDDGTLQPFKPGFMKIAHRSGALVVPAGIRGAYTAFPRGAKYPKPSKMSVHLGAPIDLNAQLPERPTAEDYAAATVMVRERVRELCEG